LSEIDTSKDRLREALSAGAPSNGPPNSLPPRDSRQRDFKIGDFWIRPQLNELEKNGKSSRIEARSMDVLVCLAFHAPRVVSKRRAINEIWQDAHIGEEVISHAIWDLRKALGDDARSPSYIQTIPRKGYRLLVEVHWAGGSHIPLTGAVIDHYEIQEQLGRGSMGVVYKALDGRLHRTVALKFLVPELMADADSCRRFRREAQLAASLDHPNLATVYEIGEISGGAQYIANAYYSGGSLKERLQRLRFGTSEAVDICSQIADGLRTAHQHGIVHRDIKPANILFAKDGTVKIVDFGIAKLLGASSATSTGISLGTPAYKSPEQSRGEEVDHRSDIWSLGVVLFEMITGARPFDAEYEQGVVHKILSKEPKLDSDSAPIPEELKQIIYRMISKNPASRYQDAAELITALRKIGDEDNVELHSAACPTPRRQSRSWKLPLLLLTLAGLLAMMASWEVLRKSTDSIEDSSLEVERLIRQGSHYESRGDDTESLEEAEKMYRKALRASPDNVKANARLAMLLTIRQEQIQHPGTSEEAYQLASKALSLDPETSLAWIAKARLALQEGDLEEAIKAATRGIELDPDCGDSQECDRGYTVLGEALYEQGRTKEGLDTIRRGTEVGRGYIRARQVLAQRLWNLGELNAAAVEYETILVYAPDYPAALNNLGIIYLETNRNLEASAIFRRLFEKTKDFRFANNLATALFNRGQWSEAIDAFEQAYKLAPNSPTVAMGLGDTYHASGTPEKARLWYMKALENFNHIVAQDSVPRDRIGQRAVCLAKLGRFVAAQDEIDGVLKESPNRATLLCYAARIRALAGDREGVYHYAQRAVQAGYQPEALLSDPSLWPYRTDSNLLELLEISSIEQPSLP